MQLYISQDEDGRVFVRKGNEIIVFSSRKEFEKFIQKIQIKKGDEKDED